MSTEPERVKLALDLLEAVEGCAEQSERQGNIPVKLPVIGRAWLLTVQAERLEGPHA